MSQTPPPVDPGQPQPMQPDYGGQFQKPAPQPSDASGKKLAAGLCGILIGGLGIHKFILGYTTAGVIMICITVLTCGFGGIISGIIGLIEGIIYLTKSDEEFYHTYMVNKREWF